VIYPAPHARLAGLKRFATGLCRELSEPDDARSL
jgi:hypothetical protein